MRAPECGFSAANCREGANSRQRIAITPAPPSHYPNRENSEGNNTGSGRDPGRPEKATARPVARRSHAHPSALARADSRGENLLALLAQPALRPDVPVERHGGDPKFAAERGHGGVDLRALPGEHPQTHAVGRQGLHGVDRVGEVAAEAGELPDDEHVARSARAHATVESRAVVAGTGRDVVVDVDGVDARGLQRIARQVQRLGAVRLGDAGVADPPVS